MTVPTSATTTTVRGTENRVEGGEDRHGRLERKGPGVKPRDEPEGGGKIGKALPTRGAPP